MPRTTSSTCTPAREARYSASITCGSVRAFMLRDDACRLAAAARGLARISFQQRRVQGERRLQQQSQLWRARQAGELQEDLVHVEADGLVRGQQPVVGVGARRAPVVVAGAQVAVAADAIALAPHDQRHLRVRLVADDAVHHVRAGFLQAVGQLDVGFLVEARRSSITTVTSLPALCAAATSASTIGESAPVR
jgi:hypothetical protein